MSTHWRDVLPIHPAADLFPLMSDDELRQLGANIRKYGLREPIVVTKQYRRREGGTSDIRDYDLVLIDGRNRLDAMEAADFVLVRDGKLDRTLGHKALGLEPLTGAYAEFEADNGAEVYAFVVSRNIHRRHLTAKQKRDLIAKLLKATPEKSDRQIGEMAKASHHTVGTVRTEMEGRGQIAHVETREDTKRRRQPARKPPPKQKPSKVPRPRVLPPVRDFDQAINALKRLRTKPPAQFAATIHSVDDLENVEAFIHAVTKARTARNDLREADRMEGGAR